MTEASNLVSLSAAVAARDWTLAQDRMAAIHEEGAGAADAAVGVEEALLQCYLFLGFPAVIEAFSVWRDLTGATEPSLTLDQMADSPEGWPERGEWICQTVYQANYEKLRANVRLMHPELDRWMITEGYGKVLGRPGLSLAARELCIVAILAVTGWERQLHSHLRGALNAEASREDVDHALETGLRLARDPDWRIRAEELWSHIRDRHTAATG